MNFYSETSSSFAEKIGVQRSSISHLLSGRNKPSLDFIMKVLHAYPEVDLYWLMNGKGEFPKIEAQEKTEIKNSPVAPILKSEKSSQSKDIEKIIIFYKDGSFESYQN
ncbi:helix-turn-helix transcriptional regulator [Winogradskyella sp.]|uniref:helix-turn-helix domain-containing protein n=1 Tax=Winogradskyella sp. TaxID=1883156 RepID=UPI003456C96C